MAITRGSDREELAVAHEMNVTPFIDVMLVLLIIFMVAAPLATVEVAVDLPSSTASASTRLEPPIVLQLPLDGAVRVAGRPVPSGGLSAALLAESRGDHDARIHVQADRRVPYERLMATMDALQAAGYRRIALVGVEAGASR